MEFGRAGGGVINVITRSGANDIHGTALWQYRSQRFNARSNTAVRNNTPKAVFSNNIYGFTVGGPIIKNKTFFFGGFQEDTNHSTANYTFTTPTADGVAKLRSLFPNNPRLNLYLDAIGSLRGVYDVRPLPLGLGIDPVTGIDRGALPIGTSNTSNAYSGETPQWLIRIDHNLSDAHRLSFRYIYDSNLTTPRVMYLPGYIDDFKGRDQTFLFSDSFTFSPTWTNEFRFSYGRIGFSFPISGRSVADARTSPSFAFPTIADLGISSGIPQFRFANNWLFQETQSKVLGRHTFRYGVEFLRQLARQRPPFNERGSYTYTNATAYSGFANFLDDFSGPSGSTSRNFGAPVYYPNLFRQSYYFQDTLRATRALTLTLGLRYENFGQPANIFPYPAFAGFDPARFLAPNKVNQDNNNFGPSFGLAWSPSYKDGLMGKLFGDGKMVWRGGYQITYDSLFNNLLSNLAADSPNTINTVVTGDPAQVNPRGTGSFFSRLPTGARVATPLDAQAGVFDPDLRNPYTQRWSFGFQRELPSRLLFDLSYVGSASHKLLTTADLNPQLPTGQRLYPNLGIRRARTNAGNSNYHAMQLRLDRRFANSFSATGSYTWSRTIDSTSEVYATTQSNSQFTSVPISQGGLKLDRALSDYHRLHRLSITYQVELPGPRSGFLSYPLGGWAVTGITTFQSGAPYTITNGFDRNADGIGADRPDISNPNAPINTRAVIAAACPTGYRNPDTGACVSPGDVHFIQGTGNPTAATVGRNTLFAGGVHNWDMNIFKSFSVTEGKKLEFRWAAFNIFNHPQFTGVPERSVLGGTAGRFLDRNYVTVGARTMWLQLKLLF
ncbi:MAG: TonB-dependent receptor [Acidobacteria bacterium]|nr:TonB-dependent receptor [Acidobacteriota bacterium]